MKWIAKHPPIYVWEGDTWYNEADGMEYTAWIKEKWWVCGRLAIDFPKKTIIMRTK
jgi:hypothetical protein